MTRVLKVAIVGHTNTGKTSLMRTLTHDVDFGIVSDRPAVTREVQGTRLLVNGVPVVELYDTPGLEDSIRLLDHLEAMREDRHVESIDLIQRLLDSPEAHQQYSQEAKALRQVLLSDVALYVIDARDRVLGKHRDELKILSMCARPIVPVLNFVAKPEARTAEWREHLSRAAMHAVAEFDTVVVNEDGEQRLFEKMRTLLDEHRAQLDTLIEDRRLQRARLITASLSLLADVLIDVAAYRVLVPINDEQATHVATEKLKQTVRQREQQCVEALLDLHRFHKDDCDPADLPIAQGQWGLDLFSPEAMKQFGIRTGSAAAAGAMAGLALDVMTGGATLGAMAAGGAALGALAGAGQSHGRRLVDRMRGKRELKCDDATIHLLEARQISLIRALLTRGHAAQNKLTIPQAPNESKRLTRLHAPLRLARTQPAWSRLEGSAGSNGKRDAARKQLTELLEQSWRS